MLPCLLDKQPVPSSTRYYKNVPLLPCLLDKQPVLSSTRYYKNVPLLPCLLDKQPVPLSGSPVPKFFSEYFV